MTEIQQATSDLVYASGQSRRLHWNTIQIRAVIFATRIYVDYLHFKIREQEKKRKQRANLPWPSETDKVQQHHVDRARHSSARTIKLLDKHLKRATRLLRRRAGESEYQLILSRWKRHLTWARIYLVYFRPCRIGCLRTRRLTVKDVKENMPERMSLPW
jgi:hypothetical protein